MAKIKVIRKNILEPEGALSVWENVQEYIRQNIRQMGAIALAVAVIAGGITLWKISSDRAEQEALTQFYSALDIMSKPPDKGADNDARYAQALETFSTIQKQHSGTLAGTASLLYAGRCSYNLKKYDDAAASYKMFINEAGSTLAYLLPAAYEGMGYALEAKGAHGEAIEWFEKQKSASGDDAGPMAMLNIARCMEESGNRGKACDTYKEFIEKNPASSFKDLAQSKIDSLCGKK